MRMSIYEKLLRIQIELKSPKNQRNNFGKYNYRSLEDIQEALKPLLEKYGVLPILQDDLIVVNNRTYVKCTIRLIDIDNPDSFITTHAHAGEEDVKKGWDKSQITGSASSYAGKYAFNKLFLLDDTQDADTEAHNHIQNNSRKAPAKKVSPKKAPAKKAEPKLEPIKYKPLINLVKEITGSDIKDYQLHLKVKWNMDKWGLEETKRLIEKVKSGELIEPFV